MIWDFAVIERLGIWGSAATWEMSGKQQQATTDAGGTPAVVGLERTHAAAGSASEVKGDVLGGCVRMHDAGSTHSCGGTSSGTISKMFDTLVKSIGLLLLVPAVLESAHVIFQLEKRVTHVYSLAFMI